MADGMLPENDSDGNSAAPISAVIDVVVCKALLKSFLNDLDNKRIPTARRAAAAKAITAALSPLTGMLEVNSG